MSAPALLVKGQNASLAASSIVVTVAVAAPSDLSALMVMPNGKVRSDADFIFFNQPDGPGVHCQQAQPGQPWRIVLELSQIPPGIDQVRVVANLENPTARFGAFAPPVATVLDSSGAELVRYEAVGLSNESIVIVVEVYRRGTDWKIRAVGQGYAGGLADLITDHGVSVDDASTSAPTPSAPPSVAAQPVAPAVPRRPVASPPSAAPSANYPPVGPPTNYPPPTSAPASYSPPPNYPPPAGTTSTPPMGSAAPQSFPPPAGQPIPPGRSAGGGGEVSLVKGRSVNLQKGQRVSLRKEDGIALSMVRMGLGWDPIKKRSMFGSREVEIDLDASAVMFADQQPVEIVFFNNLMAKDGSVQHLGDNRTGAGDGDDESIIVDLNRVPAHITAIVFIVTSYEGQTFEQVANAFCRLVDHTNNGEQVRYTLGGGGAFTGMVMAKVFRESGNWKLQAIGEGMQARTPIDAVPQLIPFL
ncbi:MAG: TerD family protein [Nakamurella sp.]